MGLAPPVSAEKPVMAVQPYKAGFGSYLQSHVCFVFGLGAVVEWSPRGETAGSPLFFNQGVSSEGPHFLRPPLHNPARCALPAGSRLPQ